MEIARYIVTPERGLFLDPDEGPAPTRKIFEKLHIGEVAKVGSIPLKPIDSQSLWGPKLVEINQEISSDNINGIHLQPLRKWFPAPSLTLVVVDQEDDQPIDGAHVIIADTQTQDNDEGDTGAGGKVLLKVNAMSPPDRILITPPLAGYWGTRLIGTAIFSGDTFRLEKLQIPYQDSVRYFYGTGSAEDGHGVRVAVIDTGISLGHPALTVKDGKNLVIDEDPEDFGDNGKGHGTHVAGIIAAQFGQIGLAPGVELISLRVFPVGSMVSDNYSVVKALLSANEFRCDIVNMSLQGEKGEDKVLRDALREARKKGMLIVMAAGNDRRAPVTYPNLYAYDEGVLVSALGRLGCFPPETPDERSVNLDPSGDDDANFIAQFSSIGKITVTAPGVAVVSTVPGGFGVMSGTSQAAPVVSALAARHLGRDRQLLTGNRDKARAVNLLQKLIDSCKSMGFPAEYEGRGMPMP